MVLACIVSFASQGAYEFYRFQINQTARLLETEGVKRTIKLFSASLAGFYATGYVSGLNLFPAEKTVKRRIFQDIRNWEESGKKLVMDRDKSEVRSIIFLAPDLAVAQVDENWFSVFQDRQTRRPISPKKANIVTIRYYLKKKWGRWIVIEYEVFRRGTQLPLVPVERVLKW